MVGISTEYLLFSLLLIVLFLILHLMVIAVHKKENRIHPIDLSMKQPLFTASACIIILAVAGFFLSEKIKAKHMAEYRNLTESLATAYAGMMAQYDVEALWPELSLTDSYSIYLENMLGRWMKQHPVIQSIYLIKKDGEGRNYFALVPQIETDRMRQIQTGLGAQIPVGKIYRTPIPELEEAFLGLVGTQPKPTEDERGYSLRTFAPVIRADGKVVGVLGISLDGQAHIDNLRWEEWKGSGLLLLPYSIILAAYWIIFRSRLEKGILSGKQRELQIQEERYRVLSDSNAEGMIIHKNGIIQEVNRALCEMFGYEPKEMIGDSFFRLFPSDEINRVDEKIRNNLSESYRIRCIHRNGAQFHCELHVKRCLYNGEPARAIAVRNITEQKLQEDTIYRLAYYDELTGLPNKKRFLRSISRWLSAAGVNRKAAVLFMDLDKFKPINDSFGHTAGDMAMKEIADRLKNAVPRGGKIARWGGDEFVALLPDISDRNDAELAAKHFVQSLESPIRCFGISVKIGTGVGISIYPDDGTDVETLIRRADTAMYTGKKIGPNCIHFFDISLQEKAEYKVRMELELREALKEGQFELHYQPQVRISTGEICGAEALIRWKHPRNGPISPAEFIPLAEESGFILELGDWVLHQACLDMKKFQAAGLPPLPIAVNLSALQFVKEDLTDKVSSVLQETGLSPELLELEITETMMMDPKRSHDILQQLKQLGVRISIDDFGTGYSSLHYLNRFPIDKLKIDRSFVMDLNGGEAPITRAIISLARTMRLEIIAEGVETPQQAEELMRLGCPFAQGYLYFKPMPKEKLLQALQSRYIG